MKLHFVNSADVSVPRWMLFAGGGWERLTLKVRYAIFEHPRLGPILIDAGYSPSLYSVRAALPLKAYRTLLRPKIHPEAHPERALRALGYEIKDVEHVILTHLHADHIGYLDLFEHAQIHMPLSCQTDLLTESRLSLARHGVFLELIPDRLWKCFKPYPERQTETPLGPACDIFGDGSIAALPLPGHATGHHGIWINGIEPVLYAVDACWTTDGLMAGGERDLALSVVSDNARLARDSAGRVTREWWAGREVVLCHDPDPHPCDLSLPADKAR